MFTFGKDRTDTTSYFTCHIFKIEKIFFISVFESRNAGKSNYKARSASRVEKKLIQLSRSSCNFIIYSLQVES